MALAFFLSSITTIKILLTKDGKITLNLTLLLHEHFVSLYYWENMRGTFLPEKCEGDFFGKKIRGGYACPAGRRHPPVGSACWPEEWGGRGSALVNACGDQQGPALSILCVPAPYTDTQGLRTLAITGLSSVQRQVWTESGHSRDDSWPQEALQQA